MPSNVIDPLRIINNWHYLQKINHRLFGKGKKTCNEIWKERYYENKNNKINESKRSTRRTRVRVGDWWIVYIEQR
jgi:hypothetical protein